MVKQLNIQQVGLFGGTFNPIHLGHLKVAQDVRSHFNLDLVIFIPSAVPPHKSLHSIAESRHRLEMVRRAVADQPGLEASAVEIKRKGPSYTIDTVNHFQKRFPTSANFFFMVGLDAFLEVHLWRSYERLLEKVPFITIARPGSCRGSEANCWNVLAEYLEAKISKGYHRKENSDHFAHASSSSIHVFDGPWMDISSTTIRRRIQNGLSIKGLVTTDVDEYIQSKRLYQ